MSVPVIDLTDYYAATPIGRRRIAQAVAQACESIGFLTVVGHCVPATLVLACREAAHAFFALPLDEKMRVPRRAPAFNRGYGQVASEGLGRSLGTASPNDLKESFSVGPMGIDVHDPYYFTAEAFPHFAPNCWPSRPPELRELLTEYFGHMQRLAADLMHVFALALELDEDFFSDKIDRHCSSLRLIHYPAQHHAPTPGQLRAGAHTDYGSLTVLQTEDVPGGLQVRTLDGQWCDVAPPQGGFVINIGDLMMNWTNDRWRSNLHRVVNPPPDSISAGARLSMVFFHQPNYDALIECLPSCHGPGRPPRYPAVTSGAHRLLKLNRANDYQR